MIISNLVIQIDGKEYLSMHEPVDQNLHTTAHDSPKSTMILKSATCACYRDDDGLHPCEAYLVQTKSRGQFSHLRHAFNLHVAPEPPKRAVRGSRTLWSAPCGCEIVFDGDLAAISVNSCT